MTASLESYEQTQADTGESHTPEQIVDSVHATSSESESAVGGITSNVLFGLARAVGHTAGYFAGKAEQATECTKAAAVTVGTSAVTVGTSAYDRIAVSAKAKELLDEGGPEMEEILLAKLSAQEAVYAQRQLRQLLIDVVGKLREAETKCSSIKVESDSSVELRKLAKEYGSFANMADNLLDITADIKDPDISQIEADAMYILKSKLGARWAGDVVMWGTQKLPEIVEMDTSDVIMAKAIADVHRLSTSVENIFVSHKSLKAIHLINRDTANRKCDERATAIRAALPLLEKNNMKLSESLIASESGLNAFQSVNGIQVVQLLPEETFVTFEGNGRVEALKRAFEDSTNIEVQVEVRLYKFSDPEYATQVSDQMKSCRSWKQVENV